MDTVEAATDLHAQIADAVVAERMPPWPATEGPDYAYDWRLTPEQIETIRAWSEAGAVEGDPEDKGQALERIGSTLSRVDLTLEMPEED